MLSAPLSPLARLQVYTIMGGVHSHTPGSGLSMCLDPW
jgi:hypothetical protein